MHQQLVPRTAGLRRASQQGRSACRRHITVKSTTFASPRAGNSTFVSEFEAALPAYWRIITEDDVVPLVPWGWGYAHAKNGVKFMRDGKLGMLTAQGLDLAGLLPSASAATRQAVRLSHTGACPCMRHMCRR